jgi:hypothetical protein
VGFLAGRLALLFVLVGGLAEEENRGEVVLSLELRVRVRGGLGRGIGWFLDCRVE